jgi:hypothetical protein
VTWFKVDDGLHSHPKTRRAGLEAIGLWSVAGSYASCYLTDGFVPEWFVDSWPSGAQLAASLVTAGLWSQATKDGEKGWSFHEWDQRNPTRADVEADREAARDRQRKHRESQRDRRVTDAVTNDVTDAVTHASSRGPARAGPVPSRPVPNSNYGSQSSDRSSARGSDGLSDQDIDKIKTRLHASRSWAEHVAAEILDRAGPDVIHNNAAYVLAAIEREPGRYKPNTSAIHPPKLRGDGMCTIHIGELADNCRGCAADAKATG